jgi:hypothetical protein
MLIQSFEVSIMGAFTASSKIEAMFSIKEDVFAEMHIVITKNEVNIATKKVYEQDNLKQGEHSILLEPLDTSTADSDNERYFLVLRVTSKLDARVESKDAKLFGKASPPTGKSHFYHYIDLHGVVAFLIVLLSATMLYFNGVEKLFGCSIFVVATALMAVGSIFLSSTKDKRDRWKFLLTNFSLYILIALFFQTLL